MAEQIVAQPPKKLEDGLETNDIYQLNPCQSKPIINENDRLKFATYSHIMSCDLVKSLEWIGRCGCVGFVKAK